MRHASDPIGEPSGTNPEDFRTRQQHRWRVAVERSARGEVAVLDSDPLKLYYAWAGRRLDLVTEAEWTAAVSDARNRIAKESLGFADVVLYEDPGVDVLTKRKNGDPTRSRRNFERHTAMRPFFREWYEAVATASPGRVIWAHPLDGTTTLAEEVAPRDDRCSVALFDRVISILIDRS